MSARRFLIREHFDRLMSALTGAGYGCVGPVVQDGAIVYRAIDSLDALPQGVREHQSPGHYRLEQHSGPRCFDWSVGPQGLKPLVFSPTESLWKTQMPAAGEPQFNRSVPVVAPLAVIGIRACDLAALALLDQHFLQEECPDPCYAARREQLFLVAVNCTSPAETCFCASTGDGPAAERGYDLLLDELDTGFAIQAGSEAGRRILDELDLVAATDQQVEEIAAAHTTAIRRQTRHLPSRNLRDVLFEQLDHPHWEDVAERCLACGNCTAVCPTCFCYREQELPAIDRRSSEHVREWDSCFTAGHSYINGITIRPDTRLRYRQWLVHKLGSWHDQYGRSGCVGCGRCISWCPTGIDITREVAAIIA